MRRPTVPCLALAGATVLLAGCGGGAEAVVPAAVRTSAPAVPPVPATRLAASDCPAAEVDELTAIARRIYAQAAAGRNVTAATRRLARSAALGEAVARGDAAAARRALQPLLKHQIVRIEITRGARVLARYGTTHALAPVRGIVRTSDGRPVGRYVLSVAGDRMIASITHAITGGEVVVRAGHRRLLGTAAGVPSHVPAAGEVVLHGTDYKTAMLPGEGYPTGRLRIALLFPPHALAPCGATTSETVANVVGAVGRRLYRTEEAGAGVRRVLRHVGRDRRFDAAVAADDPVALRTAIVRFFRTRSLHVVRIRATQADGRLVGDVGGPDVLAPASADLQTPGGAPLGRVTLSVQDDTGYIKLMHRFTGADVVLRTPAGTVAGSTLDPGPADLPASGPVEDGGRRYAAVSFVGSAFPSGPLTIALLVPEGRG